jgi:outer membrane protein
MKNSLSILLLVLLNALSIFTQAQTKGRYIPTKADGVKKIVPQQVYGNPKAARTSDSIANSKKVAEELQAKQMKEAEELRLKQEAAYKKEAEEKKRLERKQGKEKVVKNTPEKKVSNPKEKTKPPVVKETPIEREPIIEAVQKQKPSKNYQGVWPLNECVAYARENNLQVRESELNERLAKLVFEQNKASRLPNLNGEMSLGESYGRSIDPTSNQFVTKGFLYNTTGLSSQALLFGWFQKKHQIDQSKYDIEAATYAYNQLKEDVSLNVATGFLRVLLAREQVKISESQLKLDNEQYQQTIKLVTSGKLPELNSYQMLSQLSSDSATLVSNKADERIALLQLRALMNFNFEDNFDVTAPNLDMMQITNMYNLPSPEAIYSIAIENQNRMKYNQTKLLSANKALDIAKSVQYPQLSIFGNLGTNFSSNVKDITGQNYLGEVSLGNVNISGTSYAITRPDYSYTTQTRPLFKQYGNNIRLNVGLSLNVPIFNGFSAKTNIQKAKIGLVSQQIAMDNDMQRLKQDIYTAYEQAKAASQKYSSAKRAEDAAQRALDFSVKRYAIGMINTFEYTSSLNSFNNASTSALAAKYDLIFKLKVLVYYMGNPLKL